MKRLKFVRNVIEWNICCLNGAVVGHLLYKICVQDSARHSHTVLIYMIGFQWPSYLISHMNTLEMIPVIEILVVKNTPLST